MSDEWRLPTWFPNLHADVQLKLTKYRDLILKFNQAINLVSDSAISVLDQQHFADSILGSQVIHHHLASKTPIATEIFDFGSGNGFPGVVFAVLYPQIAIVAVDSDTRKAEFLKIVAHELGLKNLSVKNQQIETLSGVKFAICRGLTNIPRALLIYRKCFALRGELFHFKGEEWVNEVAAIPSQLLRFWDAEFLTTYEIPETEISLAIVRTLKKNDEV